MEVTSKMDADSFVNALVRFSARRPGVTSLISDRGTNFVATRSILRSELRRLNEEVAPELRKRGVEWSLIPAHTPHYGGVWERVVGLFKKHLATSIEGDALQIDTFNTVIVEIEGILNRRPLTILSTDSRDLEPLTPAHILHPAGFKTTDPAVLPTDNEMREELSSTWKRAQNRVNAFWKAWKRDYLSLLHDRKKWTKTRDDLREGDVVILVDESTSRSEWKLGKVMGVVNSGPHVRKVNVRRADRKVVLKDRTKVVRLELGE